MEPVAGENSGCRRVRLWLRLFPVWFPVIFFGERLLDVVSAEIALPQKKPGFVSLSDVDFAGPVAVAANAHFAGLLRAPLTWQGDLVVEFHPFPKP